MLTIPIWSVILLVALTVGFYYLGIFIGKTTQKLDDLIKEQYTKKDNN